MTYTCNGNNNLIDCNKSLMFSNTLNTINIGLRFSSIKGNKKITQCVVMLVLLSN